MRNPFAQAAMLAAAMATAFREQLARITLGGHFDAWNAGRKARGGRGGNTRASGISKRVMDCELPLRVERKVFGQPGRAGSKLARKAENRQIGRGQPR